MSCKVDIARLTFLRQFMEKQFCETRDPLHIIFDANSHFINMPFHLKIRIHKMKPQTVIIGALREDGEW